jgi:phytoene synthase
LPTQILASVGLDRDAFLAGGNDERVTAAIQAFAGFGLDHLRKARAAGAIPKSLLAAFLPATLAEPVLKRAIKIGHASLSTDIRPPQWRRQMAMMRLLLTGRV